MLVMVSLGLLFFLCERVCFFAFETRMCWTIPKIQTAEIMYVGNFHAAIICPKDQEDLARSIITRIQRRGIELEGTVTGEHGVGLHLRDMLVEEVGNNAVDMMRRVCCFQPCSWRFEDCADSRVVDQSRFGPAVYTQLR